MHFAICLILSIFYIRVRTPTPEPMKEENEESESKDIDSGSNHNFVYNISMCAGVFLNYIPLLNADLKKHDIFISAGSSVWH